MALPAPGRLPLDFSSALAARAERVATALEARPGGPDGWRPTRIIFRHFWLFDQEEFRFLHGRLFLRGANTSGKSTVLAAAVPLVLDGDRARHRLDTFGGGGRSLQYFLLGPDSAERGDPDAFYHEQRTGYVAMEFARPAGADGAAAHLTIGIGLHCSRQREGMPVTFWGFCLQDGRRLGRDLDLVGPDGTALRRQDLEAALGAGGTVVTTVGAYRELVNRALFGFADPADYAHLLQLLLELRAPKLNRDMGPRVVGELLAESLPPVDRALFEQLRTILERIDDYVDSCAELRRRHAAAERLDQAVSLVQLRRAEAASARYLEDLGRLRQALAASDAAAAVLRAAHAHREAAQARARAASERALAVEGELQALRESEVLRAEDALAGAQGRAQRGRERWEACSGRVEALGRRLEEARRGEGLARALWTTRAEALRQALARYAADATAAQWPLAVEAARGAEQELAAACAEPGDGQADLARAVQAAWLLDAARERDAALAEVRRRQDERERAEAAARGAQARFELAHEHTREARDEQARREAALAEAAGAAAAELAAWAAALHALRVPGEAVDAACRALQAHQDPAAPADTLLQPVWRAVAGHRAEAEQRHRALGRARDDAAARLAAKEDELQSWEAVQEARPPRTAGTLAARALLAAQGVAARPFYESRDLDPALDPAAAARIEAAIEQAGVLDALVVAPEDLARAEAALTAAGMGDIFVHAGEAAILGGSPPTGASGGGAAAGHAAAAAPPLDDHGRHANGSPGGGASTRAEADGPAGDGPMAARATAGDRSVARAAAEDGPAGDGPPVAGGAATDGSVAPGTVEAGASPTGRAGGPAGTARRTSGHSGRATAQGMAPDGNAGGPTARDNPFPAIAHPATGLPARAAADPLAPSGDRAAASGALDGAAGGRDTGGAHIRAQGARGAAADTGTALSLVGTAAPADAAVAIFRPDGSWRHGILAGRAAPPAGEGPRYFGADNRRRRHQQRLAELRAERADLGHALGEAEAALSAAMDAAAHAEEEAEALRRLAGPAALGQAAVRAADAAARASAAGRAEEGELHRLEQARALVAEAGRALEEAQAAVPEARGRDRSGVDELITRVGAVVGSCREAAATAARLADAEGHLARARGAVAEVGADEETARADRDRERGELAREEAAVAALRQRLESPEGRQERERYRRLREEDTRLRREVVEAESEAARAAERLDRAEANRAGAEDGVRAAEGPEGEARQALESQLTAYPTLAPHLTALRSGASGPEDAARSLLARRRDDERQSRRIADDLEAARAALSETAVETRAALADYAPDPDARLGLVRLRAAGTAVWPVQLREELQVRLLEQEQWLRAKERELYEDFLLHQMREALHARIREAEDWTEAINRDLCEAPLGSGEVLELRWSPVAGAGVAAHLRLLRSDPAMLRPEERQALADAFRAEVERVRREEREQAADLSFGEALEEALDYRAWFHFEIISRAPHQKATLIDDRRFSTRSGAEKSLALVLPLVAAVSARYDLARLEAPRLIAFDEAFAGVDPRNVAESLRFLCRFGFSWVMASERLWGVGAALPAAATYELMRRGNVVAALPFFWDGARLRDLGSELGGGEAADGGPPPA